MTDAHIADPHRIDKLFAPIFEAVKAHYAAGPPGRGRMLEVLCITAMLAGLTLKGTTDDSVAMRQVFIDLMYEAIETDDISTVLSMVNRVVRRHLN